jgi:hypothetical protein
VAKLGTFNQDRTISLKAAVRISTNTLLYLFYVLVAFSVRTGMSEIFSCKILLQFSQKFLLIFILVWLYINPR